MDSTGRSNDVVASLRGLINAVRPNAAQFGLNILLTVLIGAVISITKFSQGVMTGRDGDGDGKADNGADFVVDSALKSMLYLVTFGIAKAVANLTVGLAADIWGRKKVMIGGWVLGLLIPAMIMPATSWDVVASANIFLGLQQGICWTLTIVMMVDYAGPENRGVAVGINETIGYSTIAVFNIVAAELIGDSNDFRMRPYVAVLAFVAAGLLLSATVLRDSMRIVLREDEKAAGKAAGKAASGGTGLVSKGTASVTWPSGRGADFGVHRMAFAYASCLDKNLMLCCQAGLMINFCTAFAWGILAIWLKSYGGEHWAPLDTRSVSQVVLAYSLPKGVLQFLSGFLSDRLGRRIPISMGLALCSAALLYMAIVAAAAKSQAAAFANFVVGAVILGTGTALMYPNVIAAAAEHADPSWRASCLGTYRFWRDLGYAVGGIILGATADASSAVASTIVGAVLTAISALLFGLFYTERVEAPLDMAELTEEAKQDTGVRRIQASNA